MEVFIKKSQLLVATISAVVVGFAVYGLTHPDKIKTFLSSAQSYLSSGFNFDNTPISSSTFTPTSTSTTNTFTPTPTSTTSTFTPTPSNYPTPIRGILGTNVPEGFEVEEWLSDFVKCDQNINRRTVKIYGVIIVEGTKPYQFDFWRFGTQRTNSFISNQEVKSDGSLKETVMFENIIEIDKNLYYRATVSFLEGGVIWIDDLLYLSAENDRECKSEN